MFGHKPHRLELAGVAVGLAGVLLLVRGASFAAAPAGLACISGAALAWSLGSVLATARLPLAPGPAGFASEMLCGGAVLMLVSLALGEQFAWPPQLHALAAWACRVLFGSLGVLVGGEVLSGGEWLACSVILGGVFRILRGKTAREPR